MKQLFVCLAILSFATIISTEDCRSNLLTSFGFTPLDNPTNVTGLNFCKSLRNSTACCSAATINSFQAKTENLTQKFTGYVATRDQEMVKARDVTIPSMRGQLQAFKDAYNQMLAQYNQLGQSGDILKGVMEAAFGTLLTAMDQALGGLDNIRNQYKDYQKSRSTCVVQLVKVQAATWCLACDANYANKGSRGTAVTLSDRVCNRLQSACYNYVTGSVLQGSLFYTKTIGSLFQQMTDSLSTGNMNMNSTIDLSGTGAAYVAMTTAQLAAALPTALPANCTSATSCSWICTSLFNVSSGQINDLALAMGGQRYNASSARILIEEDGRKLQQSTSFDPDEDEAGVTVTFSEDPGNTNQAAGGSLLGVSMTCVVGMLVALLF